MNVLIDSNVILDAILKRSPWFIEAAEIWAACEQGDIIGLIPASVMTDIFYLTRRGTDINSAFVAVDRCLQVLTIMPIDRAVLEDARKRPGNDFEDNVQIACAVLNGLDAIVTRDPSGFAHSPVPVLTPQELLTRL